VLPGLPRRGDSPVELKGKLHRSRVGLDIRDASKGATRLVNGVGASTWCRWQAPVRIGKARILMIEGVKQLPAKLQILGFREMKILPE